MLGHSSLVPVTGLHQGWTLSFAREPEPDLDLEDMPEGEMGDGSSSQRSPRPPGRRPAALIFLLVIVAVGAYIAMDPGTLMNLLGTGTEPVSDAPAPPMAKAPAPRPLMPGPPPAAQPSKPGAPAPSAPPAMPAPAPPRATAPAPTPTPLYREGQRVAAVPDPTQPGGPIALHADPAGTRPGPTVQPGTALTVLDGEWRGNAWIYSVRTQDGATGWIPEGRLKAKS